MASEGELICIDCESQEITIIGVVEAGVIAASQSPDEELVLIFTGDGNILCMTSDFEVMSEVRPSGIAPKPKLNLIIKLLFLR